MREDFKRDLYLFMLRTRNGFSDEDIFKLTKLYSEIYPYDLANLSLYEMYSALKDVNEGKEIKEVKYIRQKTKQNIYKEKICKDCNVLITPDIAVYDRYMLNVCRLCRNKRCNSYYKKKETKS